MPALVIDTSSRPDIAELIRIHKHTGPGDVNFWWSRSGADKVGLRIVFKRPTEVTIDIEFDVKETGGVVDQIITSQLAYIQGGQPGDTVSQQLDKAKILVEIPNTEFKDDWPKIWARSLTKQFKSQGHSKKEATNMAEQVMSTWRSFGRFRIEE
ncbi:hypothetical protein GCM10027590_37070 [Nocardiopsis nanhaiensis]